MSLPNFILTWSHFLFFSPTAIVDIHYRHLGYLGLTYSLSDERVVEVIMMGISYLTSVFLLRVPCKLSQYHSVLLKARMVIYETLSIRIAAELKGILTSVGTQHAVFFNKSKNNNEEY